MEGRDVRKERVKRELDKNLRIQDIEKNREELRQGGGGRREVEEGGRW